MSCFNHCLYLLTNLYALFKRTNLDLNKDFHLNFSRKSVTNDSELMSSSIKAVKEIPSKEAKESSVSASQENKNGLKEAKKTALNGSSVDTDNMSEVSMPKELTEMFVQVMSAHKALVAIYMLKTLGYRRMLCFVSSRDTAKRLNKLFELCKIRSMEYSSALHAARRK